MKNFAVARFARSCAQSTEARDRFASFALTHQRSGGLPEDLIDDYIGVLATEAARRITAVAGAA
jgi:hypothetical protein